MWIVNKVKKQIKLQQTIDAKLSIKEKAPFELDELINDRHEELVGVSKELDTLKKQKNDLSVAVADLLSKKEELGKDIIDLTEQLEMESFGIYKPHYSFSTALEYKDKLGDIRKNQKDSIKNKSAYIITFPLTFNNSRAKGKTIQNKNAKQLLRTFNGECDAAIASVKYSNIDRIEKRIEKSFEQLNKLNDGNGVNLDRSYLNLKKKELHLAFEYAEKKQQEKDALREQRLKEREEKALQKEISIKRKKIDKDLSHFEKMFAELEEKLQSVKDENEQLKLKNDLEELQQKIDSASAEKSDLDYREANATAGYVYIISNIGSFGKDVFKIGVTRRLEPMDRIDELGSASVPFKFDIHALIFSYDAYKLESKLHERFAKNRINKVNNRKEYFNITIEDVKGALKEYSDVTIDFKEVPEAIEYRDSMKIN
jgi:T5orf172 domain.